MVKMDENQLSNVDYACLDMYYIETHKYTECVDQVLTKCRQCMHVFPLKYNNPIGWCRTAHLDVPTCITMYWTSARLLNSDKIHVSSFCSKPFVAIDCGHSYLIEYHCIMTLLLNLTQLHCIGCSRFCHHTWMSGGINHELNGSSKSHCCNTKPNCPSTI